MGNQVESEIIKLNDFGLSIKLNSPNSVSTLWFQRDIIYSNKIFSIESFVLLSQHAGNNIWWWFCKRHSFKFSGPYGVFTLYGVILIKETSQSGQIASELLLLQESCNNFLPPLHLAPYPSISLVQRWSYKIKSLWTWTMPLWACYAFVSNLLVESFPIRYRKIAAIHPLADWQNHFQDYHKFIVTQCINSLTLYK